MADNDNMKTKSCYVKVVLLIAALVVMVATSAAAQGVCVGEGQLCSGEDTCCPGTACRLVLLDPATVCQSCPVGGQSCGLLDYCCPGYSCSNFFNDTCK